jgi:hypothetical protein
VTTVGFDHSFLWVGHTGRTGNDLIWFKKFNTLVNKHNISTEIQV